jgi:FKBP-type peptidyl-prolyl cis-trans isomerase
MRLLLCCAAVAVALIVGGCGSDSGSSSTTGDQAATTTTPVRQVTVLHHVNRLPRPASPGPHPGAKVDQLIVRDVRKGIGPAIKAGDSGQFDFIATDWVTGRSLDSSWRRKRVFSTQIEHNVVIDGWWQGIPGMRVGGERRIIVPPSLGFTSNPLLLRATTYFDIVLLQIEPQRPTGLGGAARAPPAPRASVE